MDLSEITQKRVVYSIPDMEQSIVRPNIPYKSVDGLCLQADIYYPRDFNYQSKLPAVIFVHGDGPSEIIKNTKDWGQYVAWGQLIAVSGFAAITFNHRSSEDKLSKMVDVSSDVQDLLSYVLKNADELNINGDYLCIWACSAGVPYLQTVMETPQKYVRCIVVYYGMMNFQQFADTLPVEMSDKERESLIAIFRKFSLSYHLANCRKSTPPMFIAQAGQDNPSMNETIERFVEQAADEGVHVEFLQHPNGQHGFDVMNDDEKSRQIIKQTLNFIQAHLASQ
jgi:acetyl esterase/lipase